MLLKRVVVGSTIEAAIYALLEDAVFLNTRLDPPMFYRELPFSILGSTSEPELWTKICLKLSFLGQRLDITEVGSIRIRENTITIIDDLLKSTYSFEECVVFDATRVDLEAKIQKARQPLYLVLDDLELSCLGKKVFEMPEVRNSDDFVSRINFYSSDRIDGAKHITDCVVESYLTKDQLYEYEYSDTVVRFTVEKALSSLGVNGRFMKMYENGNPKYRKPVVKHVKRLVFEKDQNEYRSSKSVKFANFTLQEMVNAKGA